MGTNDASGGASGSNARAGSGDGSQGPQTPHSARVDSAEGVDATWLGRVARGIVGMAAGPAAAANPGRQGFWIVALSVAIVAGLGVMIIYAFAVRADQRPLGAVMAVGLLLAGAALMIGSAIGFLFGIPRTVEAAAVAATSSDGKGDSKPEVAAATAGYRHNTNLEQISDWLTKIIVGVGLVEFQSIRAWLDSAATRYATTLGNETSAYGVAMSAILFFWTAGFLFSFLWTRLYLRGAMQDADMSVVRAELENKERAQQNADALALSLTEEQLDSVRQDGQVEYVELRDAIAKASPRTKVEIFFRAARQRKEFWDRDKVKMARTIPVLQALCEADTEGKFHKHFGHLGYALKDKQPPDYRGAIQYLNRAIEIRGARAPGDEAWYEMNRALARIRYDEAKPAGAAGATPEPQRGEIIADLKAWKSSPQWALLQTEKRLAEPLDAWLTRNGLTRDTL